jgi:hypothetical protein
MEGVETKGGEMRVIYILFTLPLCLFTRKKEISDQTIIMYFNNTTAVSQFRFPNGNPNNFWVTTTVSLMYGM